MHNIASKCSDFLAVTPAHRQIRRQLILMGCDVFYNRGGKNDRPWMVIGIPEGWSVEEYGSLLLVKTWRNAVRFVDFRGDQQLGLKPALICIHTAQIRLNRIRNKKATPSPNDHVIQHVFDVLDARTVSA